MIRLDGNQSKAIRKALAEAKEAIHISEICRRTGLEARASQVNDFVSNYLQNTTKEVVMAFEDAPRGRRFSGWRMTPHGLDLYRNVG
jgi:hypothetical protein